MRTSEITRKTAETEIELKLNLDGTGVYSTDTGCGFLDHMLSLFSKHSGFDLDVKCKGDTYVDYHHTVEDVGIVLGQAFLEASGDKKGIVRYGDCTIPMDEALILCAADVSGRGYLGYALDIKTEKVGDFDTELVQEFFTAFARESGITVHIRQIAGINTHHIIEGAFKAFARALRKAFEKDSRFPDALPSTKGVL